MKVLIGGILICGLIMVSAFGFCMEDIFSQTFPEELNDKLEKLQIYFETGLYDEAAELLDGLMAQFPDEIRFVYLRGIVDYQRQDYERAESIFGEFIEQYPDVPEPYYLLSELNLKKGDIEKAKQYLSKYCALVPEDFAARRKLDEISNNTDSSSETVIIKDGKEDKQVVGKMGFYGYGTYVRKEEDKSIKLINGCQQRWASMGIDFAYPLDLRGKQAVLELKGRQGGEKFALTFRDKFTRDYNPQLVLEPETEIMRDWQKIRVILVAPGSEIDLSNVVHMGLEFGSSTVQNPPNTTLFIKDIIIEDAYN